MRAKNFSVNSLVFLILILFHLPIFSQESTIVQTKTRPSVALVLGGGGAKGYGILPVLEVIDELGIPVDMVIGNSAGAIIGGLYCIGYTPKEIHNAIIHVDWSHIFSDNPTSPLEVLLEDRSSKAAPIAFGKNFSFGGGLTTGQNAYLLFKELSVKIPSYIDFDSLPIPFRATTVNLVTGRLELLEEGDIAEAIRSSMSIPGVFQPFPLNGNLYVDGFVRNNLPIQQAKNMGYDIVIAISLDDPLIENTREFDINPRATISQILKIVTSSGNTEQLQLADLVIQPPIEDFNTMDFQKAEQIYEKSKKEKDNYRRELKTILTKIFPQEPAPSPLDLQYQKESITQAQQSIKNHDDFNIIYNGFAFTPLESLKKEPEGEYHNIPYLIPQELIVYGAVNTDEAYIQSIFSKIKGRPLTEKKLQLLVESIYATGNYNFVIPRVDVRSHRTVLELKLYQTEKKNWFILPNINLASTLTDDSMAKFSLSCDIQFRGLTGRGSGISLKASILNDFGVSLLYIQALNAHNHLQLATSAFLDQEIITSGFTSRKITANKIAYANIGLLWGIKLNENHKFQTMGDIYWLNTSETSTPTLDAQRLLYPNTKATVALPLRIGYTFNTLDSFSFPSKGFYLKINTAGVFPIMGENTPVAFNMTKINFSTAIPIAPKFTLIMNTMIASDLTLQLEKIPDLIPFFGMSLGDRMFFPNISGRQEYGTQKLALQVMLQFQPWQDITIMGGQLFFNITGTTGVIALDHKDFSVDGVNWNASFGAGLQLNDALCILLRGGVGTTHHRVMPFISLDIGNIRY